LALSIVSLGESMLSLAISANATLCLKEPREKMDFLGWSFSARKVRFASFLRTPKVVPCKGSEVGIAS